MVNLKGIKKCDQYWDQMPSTGNGRMCLACKKNLIDFSQKTTAEIMHIHATSQDQVCGYYSKKQWRISEKRYQKRSNDKGIASWRSLGFWSFLALFWSGTSAGQSEPSVLPETSAIIEQVSSHGHPDTIQLAPAKNQTSYIQGRVTVNEDNEVNSFAMAQIQLSCGDTIVYSDFDGYYQIPLPDIWSRNESFVLKVSALGYVPFSVKFDSIESISRHVDVELTPSEIIEFGVVRAPFYKRWWWKFSSLFRR